MTPQPELDRPAFIIGSASSGTTLLGVMLDRHSAFACGPELYAFDKGQIYQPLPVVRRNFGQWLKRGLVSDGQIDTPDFFHSRPAYFCDRDLLAHMMREAESLRDFFDAFFRNYLAHRGKSRWAEKTGSNGYCLGRILKLYPSARVIHLVRDGRDVVCSLLKRDPRPYHAVSHWLYNVSAALAWRGHPAYLEVRYETLAAEPEVSLRTICQHLEIPFEPQMLAASADEYWRQCAPTSIHSSWGNSPFDGGTSTRSIGRWRHELTPQVEALFWRMRLSPWGRRRLRARGTDAAPVCAGVADLMRLLGYADEPPIALCPVPLRMCGQGLRQFWRRARDHWRCNRRLWLPLTQLVGRGT
jgi:protein-tyrosine sulfotransferase